MKIKGHITFSRSDEPPFVMTNDEQSAAIVLTKEHLAKMNATRGDFLVGINNPDDTRTIVCIAVDDEERGVELEDVVIWLTLQKWLPK